MDLRYIDYAGGNFRSCRQAGPEPSPQEPASPAPAGAAHDGAPAVVPDAPASTAAPPPATELTPDQVTAQALKRLAERRAREAERHAVREAERRARQEALVASRRANADAEQARRSTERAAMEADRRTRRAAKQAKKLERKQARERRRIAAAEAKRAERSQRVIDAQRAQQEQRTAPPAAPARRIALGRRGALAANAAAALSLAAAAGISIWYFAAEHGRFERETRRAAMGPARSPAPAAAAPSSARAALPRVAPAALMSVAALESAVERKSFQAVARVQRGDSFFTLLMRSGVPGAEAQLANISLSGVFDVRKMRPGQLVTVDFGILGQEHNRFLAARFDSNYDRTVWVQRQPRGDFVATEVKKDLTLEVLRSNGVIDNSVFQAGLQAGLPPDPVVRMIHLFAYDVDFQRDLQKGDSFEALIEQHRDRNGDIVRYGNILFAALTLQGATIRLYRWQGDDGEVEYYSEKGDSSRKALMRTPIDGARLSSGFGLRRHPILGYSKLHQGVDFAAPTGTPIYAAGSGLIEKIGWAGGYGNSITVRHTKEYSTLYGHMSAFAPGLAVGRRVNQGDIIGFVGSTGLSTGPHLHYEVHLASKPIDPLSLKLPSRQRLQGAELARFLDMVKLVDTRYAALARNGGTGQPIVLAAEQEADTGCVNGARLDPTDKRSCD